ncbi:PepSY domain-containing protein [Salinisphaera sp.]|uniref:PepSY domain-containing protein n=1 Tax=Salinisphaera sp. TaxID=1914330 RepID=UPI002D765B59|nr:PepSY domain-containing protein [Salinisphaera sp.]HET7313339.1 PepSY domain-containing protein [Salinisphaera sp.]
MACVLMCAVFVMAYSPAALAQLRGYPHPTQLKPEGLRHGELGPGAGHGDHPRHARPGQQKRGPSHDDRNPPAITTPEQAAQRARARFGGRVLNVILEHGPGGPYYRVKLLKNGRVRVVDIDARR